MQSVELGMSGRGARNLEKPKVNLQPVFFLLFFFFYQAELGTVVLAWVLSWALDSRPVRSKAGHSIHYALKKIPVYNEHNPFHTGDQDCH